MSAQQPVRCLVVDDSATFRAFLRDLLQEAGGLEIVGEAHDADSAIQQAIALKPDVITMDVQLPGRDGIDAIREIMAVLPTPVVVICSGASDELVGIAFRALQAGAVDVLGKPDTRTPSTFAAKAAVLGGAVRAAASVRPAGPAGVDGGLAPSGPPPGRPTPIQCVGLVGAIGGPSALRQLLSLLPADLPVPLLVVQHLAPGMLGGLAQWLSQGVKQTVRVAQNGEPLQPGTVLLAPEDAHLMVSLGKVRLDAGAPVRGLRPSGSVLLASLAKEFGVGAAGVVLTGLGDDGRTGIQLMRQRGGLTLAQRPEDALASAMPAAAIATGAVEHVLGVDALAEALTLAGRPALQKAKQRRLLLLVDDTETILEMERQILSTLYDVVLARDGQEAVETATRLLPAGIVMDFSMPRMNGAQAIAALGRNAATASIPIIVVTSETAPSILASCAQAGCKAILRKPIDAPQLVHAVGRIAPP